MLLAPGRCVAAYSVQVLSAALTSRSFLPGSTSLPSNLIHPAVAIAGVFFHVNLEFSARTLELPLLIAVQQISPGRERKTHLQVSVAEQHTAQVGNVAGSAVHV